MKVSIPNKPVVFNPIEVTLVIESQEELDSLIARLSIGTGDVNDVADRFAYRFKERATTHTTDLLLQKLELFKG